MEDVMFTLQFEKLATQVEQLSVQDRLRLIERLTATIQRDLVAEPVLCSVVHTFPRGGTPVSPLCLFGYCFWYA